ncbi:hypothetical protein BAE44_0000058 [Dichanthelium oligosanthes]|uniref:Metal tolerance protein C2 n=1 Tax=Dichanthelium oligosanthes TaxID=888268 RepID=A0A1E5WNE9_9POAL|nr:hypothetical protein BAE44_0000058 [Dichanthelium oligosanthes]
MAMRYSALTKIGFAVLACNLALAIHDARADAGSLASVFASYVALVTLTWLFLRNFGDRAHGRGVGRRPDQGPGVGPDDAPHGDVRVEAGAA